MNLLKREEELELELTTYQPGVCLQSSRFAVPGSMPELDSDCCNHCRAEMGLICLVCT